MTNKGIKNYLMGCLRDYSSPKLIYDLEEITKRLSFIRKIADDNDIHVLFSVKSFPHSEILNLASQYVHGFEISNVAEYELLPKNNAYQYISVSNPIVALDEILFYIADKNKIVFYNLDYLDDAILKEIIGYQDYINLKFGLRITHTSFGILSPVYKKGVDVSRFGMNIDKVSSLWNESFLVKGFHLHNGSEMNNVETYLFMAYKLLDFLDKFKVKLEYINFGGGLSELSNNQILILFMELRKIIPESCKIFFEPGRFFSKGTGYMLAKIVTVKKISETQYLATVDISYECHLKWSVPQYFSFLKEVYSDDFVKISFYGATCYEGDFILSCGMNTKMFSEIIGVGKTIVFKNIDGYAVAWNSSFNGIPQIEVDFYNPSVSIDSSTFTRV